MVKLKIKYFLTQCGLAYFPAWYDELLQVLLLQDGLLTVRSEQEKDIFIVYLNFENQEKLIVWAETSTHDNLFTKIEQHFIKPVEVERKFSESHA